MQDCLKCVEDCLKYLFAENFLVTIIVIFVILYIYLNTNIIYSGEYFSGQLSKPITYTCIIVLIGILLLEFMNYGKDIPINNKENIITNVGGQEKTYKIVKKNKDIFISNNNRHMFGINM